MPTLTSLQIKLVGIIAMLAILSGVYFYVKHLQHEIELAKTEVITLQSALNLQNASIDIANKDKETAQKLLDSTINSNKLLKQSIANLKSEVIAAPKIDTCEQAFESIKDFSINMSKDWNSK